MTRISNLLCVVLISSCAAVPVVSTATTSSATKQIDDAKSSVVLLRTAVQIFNFREPWKKSAPHTGSIHGIVIGPKKILVPATVLAYSTYLEAKKAGVAKWFPARVLVKDYEFGLALVTVDDDAFWADLRPMVLSVDTSKEAFRVWHWHSDSVIYEAANPIGYRANSFGCSLFASLSIELLSNFETTGDGEPVTDDKGLVGIVVERSGKTLLAIAISQVKMFLAASEQKPYPGFGRAGIETQTLIDDGARAYFHLGKDDGGVLITKVLSHESAAGTLKAGDVLLKIDELKVDETGYIKHPQYGRLAYDVAWTLNHIAGDKVRTEVLRDGKREKIDFTLKRKQLEDDRVPVCWLDKRPEYLVYQGLVFEVLTVQYLMSFGGASWRSSAPGNLLMETSFRGRESTPENRRAVVLSHVIPNANNMGYQDLRAMIVSSVNGITIHGIEDLKHALSKPKEGFQVVDFAPGQNVARVVLPPDGN